MPGHTNFAAKKIRRNYKPSGTDINSACDHYADYQTDWRKRPAMVSETGSHINMIYIQKIYEIRNRYSDGVKIKPARMSVFVWKNRAK